MAFGAGGQFDKKKSMKEGYGSNSPFQTKRVKQRREKKKRNKVN